MTFLLPIYDCGWPTLFWIHIMDAMNRYLFSFNKAWSSQWQTNGFPSFLKSFYFLHVCSFSVSSAGKTSNQFPLLFRFFPRFSTSFPTLLSFLLLKAIYWNAKNQSWISKKKEKDHSNCYRRTNPKILVSIFSFFHVSSSFKENHSLKIYEYI